MKESEMYRHLYALLCFAASEAVEQMDLSHYDLARETLTEALETAEEFYIENQKE